VSVPTTLALRLPYESPPLLMNQLRSKTHWRAQHAAHQSVIDAVWTMCKAQRIGLFAVPVVVTLTWHAKHKRRRDPDSLAPMVKGCLDGLVRAGVLTDDSSTYVHDVHLRIVIGADDPRVELEVAPVAEDVAS
jgi:Holliday junction resolvase RusA-like endonuclease